MDRKLVKIGITEKKDENFSEWYTQTVLKAELIDYSQVKGFIILREYGFSIWENIQAVLDKKFKKDGTKNAYFPLLIPESLLNREADHFKGFTPEVFWVTKTGNNDIENKLAIRPTSETIAYESYAKWIKSWRDLPLKLNFWNSVLRAEIKDTKPFIRTSEFLWQEGHTVHETKDDATQQVEFMLELYKRFVNEYLALPILTGKKSDKEKFVGADYTLTLEGIMPDGKALQMGTSHFLGQNFSKPFDVKFSDSDNVENFAWQTSWGVSWRLIGGMIMLHGDDNGLVLPPRVAPIQVVIIPIYYSDKDKENVVQKATEIHDILEKNNVRVKLDDRDQVTPGFKFNDWELKGIPLRIEIGPKDVEKKKVVLARRHNREKHDQEISGIEKMVLSELVSIHNDMFADAKKILDGKTVTVSTYVDFKSELEKGRMIHAPICSNQQCEEKIKEETGADVRVVPENSDDKTLKCIYCEKQSESIPLFARGY